VGRTAVAVAGFDLLVDCHFAVGVFGASGAAIRCLQLIVNVVGRGIQLCRNFEMRDRFLYLSIFQQYFS
jgi:hypothetical protein